MGGSFACRCPPGFQLEDYGFDQRNKTTTVTVTATPTALGRNGAGMACVDVDECNPDNGVAKCGTNAKCINFPGSYRCLCPSGFQGQGYLHCES